jgi:hypothetical protein
LRERAFEKGVVGEIRRPSLQAPFGKLLPSRFWSLLDLFVSIDCLNVKARIKKVYLLQQKLLFFLSYEL